MPQKSRVLILTTAYLPEIGGSELAIKNITDRLPGICFDLITSRSSKKLPAYEKMGAVNVYRIGNSLGLVSFLLPKNFFPIAVFLKARQLIRQHGVYDVIHAYQASQAAGGGWLLKWRYPKIPFLVTMQEGKVLSQQSWLMRFFRYLIFRKADAVTAISNYLVQYIRSQNSTVSISLIPNGVDFNKFKSNGDHNPKIIITVSRLVDKNGVAYLIKAMKKVVEKISDAKLIIVGSGYEERLLKQLTNDLGLKNSIEFAGEVPYADIPQYLARASVFVRPSLSEGLGSAFIEAMAAGVAIIGTPVGGIPDFLKDPSTHSGQATGLFCKPGDLDDIADKIIEMIEDNGLRQKLTENDKRLVEEEYSWDKIAKKFEDVYSRI